MATARRVVDLTRTLRGTAGLRVRQPLARMWLALPGADVRLVETLLGLIADEVNVKAIERIDDESTLVDRRVKPLLPKIGKRLGAAIPAVMAAARDGAFEFHADGSVTLGGVTLAADEVEILATPRPGTAVAHDEGLVVVIDTELTPALRAEGDARELQRAIQDLRKDAGLDLDARIELWVAGLPAEVVAASRFRGPRDARRHGDPGRRTGSRRRRAGVRRAHERDHRRRDPRAPRRVAGHVSEIRSEPTIEAHPNAGALPAAPTATPRTTHWATFLGLAGVIVVADQLTKAWLVSFLAPGQSVDVIGDTLRLVFSQNNGGLFGLFHGQALVFGLVSLVVVGLDRAVPRPCRSEHVPVDHPRAAARAARSAT